MHALADPPDLTLPPPVPWHAAATTGTDCTLQQLAPYIGRIKTTIAQYLIERCTEPSDIVVDPFCGSGVVPLEAVLRGRGVIAGDINPYGVVLTRAKLFAPTSLDAALAQLGARWRASRKRLKCQDLRSVPQWVRSFFHPETLRDSLAFRDECVARRDWFLLACILGILHHQRPGFLSFPSSHLVPYLRGRLFPRDRFPELYEYREVFPRLEAKVARTFRRVPDFGTPPRRVWHKDARTLPVTTGISAVITSPPYMNELDYVRDNRLRLWFLTRANPTHSDLLRRDREHEFRTLVSATCGRLAPRLAKRGVFALVVGEVTRGGRRYDSANIVIDTFRSTPVLHSFDLVERVDDFIPDVRRARRDVRGTKRETILIFQRG